MDKPLVFSVQHCCVHDGPGIRTTIFFKGCTLRCVWCQNPESWKKKAEIAFKAHRCLDCGLCARVCTEHLNLPGRPETGRCTVCRSCVEACPAQAMVCVGEKMDESGLLSQLRPEYANYRATGGGVTFSGGEAGLFPEFISDLAGSLKQDGIHLAMESCGMYDDSNPAMKELMGHLDLLLFDVKIFDEQRHKIYCGTTNNPIKTNLEKAVSAMVSGSGPLVWPRLPLVPGMTDDLENLSAWAEYLGNLGLRWITILPYHDHGAGKRLWLGDMPENPAKIRIPDADDVARAKAVFQERGIDVSEAGEETFPNIASLHRQIDLL